MTLDELHSQLSALVEQALTAIRDASGEQSLQLTKARFMGKTGPLTALMAHMRDLTAEQRPAFGKAVNDAKASIETALESARGELKGRARAESLGAAPDDLRLGSGSPDPSD
jgi:phenylalanyl-tRNA synthetase alpha chain